MDMATKAGRKGQVFSIDVLFSILPVMMILGASLQYLYLAEEQMKTLSEESELDNLARGLADYVANADPTPRQEDCNLVSAIEEYSNNRLPERYVYHVMARSYYDYTSDPGHDLAYPNLICTGDDDKLWHDDLEQGENPELYGRYANVVYKNTASSQLRFMLEHDDAGNPIPGHIAGISFSVWEDKP